jgi:hypothetical protein
VLYVATHAIAFLCGCIDVVLLLSEVWIPKRRAMKTDRSLNSTRYTVKAVFSSGFLLQR